MNFPWIHNLITIPYVTSLFLNPYRARPWIWVYKATMETLHLQRRRHFGRSQISGGTRFTRARLTHRQQICSGSNHAGIQATKKAKARYQVSSRFYLWIKNVPSFFTRKKAILRIFIKFFDLGKVGNTFRLNEKGAKLTVHWCSNQGKICDLIFRALAQ